MNERYAKCIPFDKNVKGRIGGNPPKCIEGQIPCDYKFYATLVHPEKENIMLSIIIHQDYDTLIDNNIYPSIAVKVIEHEFSEIGNCAEKRNASLDMCSISEYSEDKDSENILVKIGGEPSLIQDEESYYKELEKHGFSSPTPSALPTAHSICWRCRRIWMWRPPSAPASSPPSIAGWRRRSGSTAA